MDKTSRNQLKKIVNRVEQDPEILALFLYGSAAREEDNEQSDVDLCLVLMPASYSPQALSKRKLAYLKAFDLDIQVFQQLPLYIKKRVMRDGKMLHCKDEDALYELSFSVMREFSDFEHIYRDYLAEIENAG